MQSAPATTTRREQEQIEEAIRQSLQDSQSPQPPKDQDISTNQSENTETVVMEPPSTNGKRIAAKSR